MAKPLKNPQAGGLPLITRTSFGPAFVGLPRSTFYHFAKTDPTFPKKVHLSPHASGYVTAELVAWVESKKQVAE